MHIRDTPRGPVLMFDDGVSTSISMSQATVLTALMARKACAAADLARLVWPNGRGFPASWRQIVAAYVRRLRRAGVAIVTVRGKGYALEEGDDRGS